MPKRSYEDSDEDKWERKLKKYKKKLDRKRKQRRVLIYSDSDASSVEELQEKENENEPNTPLVAREVEPPPQPDVATTNNIPETIIDADFLKALGDDHVEAPVWGEDILSHLSDRWEPILRAGIKKDVKEGLHKKYLFPKNAPFSKPPLLNPEIRSVLTDSSRNRDGRVEKKQEQLGRALAALGKAMSGIMTKSMETPQVLEVLNDVGKLIVDSHFLETDTRRSLIMPLLDKSFIDPIKDRKRDAFLFGDQLKDFIKSSRGIKKSGQLITPTQISNLNWKGPSTSQLRTQRSARAPPTRSIGSSRAQWSGRRRAPYHPPAQSQQAPAYAATTRRQAPSNATGSHRPPPAPSTSRGRNPTK